MSDCAITMTRFDTLTGLALEATFDGGKLTSDGSLALVARADSELGLCEAIAACVRDWRRGIVRYSLLELVRQRVYQIACGYEDQDDADTFRSDPLLRLVCGRLPETGADLASQPTMSRLENSVSTRACLQIATAVFELSIRERGKAGTPERILLDFDSTDDPTHGDQEGSYYHGYYEQHMYHPLVVLDGDTEHLITPILRSGNSHASRGTVTILSCIVRRLRETWPDVVIEVRADAGSAVPAVYEYCGQEGVEYTIGLISNSRLEQMAQPLLSEAQGRYDAE